MDKLIEQVKAIVKTLNCKFTLKGEPIAIDKVISNSGLLPSLLRRADQLASFCLGYGLGVTFERAEGSMTGVMAELDDKTSHTLRLLCVTDVLIEIMQSAPSYDATPVDSLMQE